MKGLNSTVAGTMTFSQDSNNPIDSGYAYSNALLGVLDQYTESSSRFPMYEFNTTVEWYLQDTWKVSHNLTVDAGLRWGWGTPWHANHNQEAAFVPTCLESAASGQADSAHAGSRQACGAGSVHGLHASGCYHRRHRARSAQPDQRHRQPPDRSRISARHALHRRHQEPGPVSAWPGTRSARAKTVNIRTGAGIFYDFHEVDNFGYGYEFNTPPLQYNPILYYTYANQIGSTQGYNFPSNVSGFDPNRPVQKTYNFSFGFQQDLGFGTVADVAAVGALGRHLVESENLNSAPLGTDYLPSSLDASNGNKVLPSQFLRPYPGWGNITYYLYSGNSHYYSLQTAVRRRYKNNLTYGVIWTWSKVMDYSDTETSSSTTSVSSLINPKVWNYGMAGYDHTHIFRVYWNYNLPRATNLLNNKLVGALFNNWQVSGIFTAQSGAPTGFNVAYSPSADVTGSPTDTTARPILTGNPILPKDQRSINEAFNVAAIAAPSLSYCGVANPPFICWGNANKDIFRGPGINNWDSSLFKNMPFFEGRLRAQLRVEAYNLFNHTQFTTVGTTTSFNAAGQQTNGTFGQYTAAANPRQLQCWRCG